MTDAAPHPAQFSDVIIERLSEIVLAYARERGRVSAGTRYASVCDPFAGVGGIHKLCQMGPDDDPQIDTVGVELEPRWAAAHPRTFVGSALAIPYEDQSLDCIVTSPCYGNRMADHHEAKDDSKRITYRHYLGEPLQDGNAGAMQWGQEYKVFHQAAWTEAYRVLKPGGLFVVNVSNHIRKFIEQPVVEWHLRSLLSLGLYVEKVEKVVTPRMRNGANANLRVDAERILVLRK